MRSSKNRTPWTIIIGQTVRMEPKMRLLRAIHEAGYETPTDAWRDNRRELGISQDLLISNTNGNRPISRKAAQKYAAVFGHTAGWYLFGDETAKEEAVSGTTSLDTVSALTMVFADLVKASPATQARALKLLRKTVYGQPGNSRETSTKQSS